MKIYEWYEYLPEKIRDKAQAYFFEHKEPEEYKDKLYSLSSAIMVGFNWSESKEGANYWCKIYNKSRNFKP